MPYNKEHLEGRTAFIDGEPRELNPYPKDSDQYRDWANGWLYEWECTNESYGLGKL